MQIKKASEPSELTKRIREMERGEKVVKFTGVEFAALVKRLSKPR